MDATVQSAIVNATKAVEAHAATATAVLQKLSTATLTTPRSSTFRTLVKTAMWISIAAGIFGILFYTKPVWGPLVDSNFKSQSAIQKNVATTTAIDLAPVLAQIDSAHKDLHREVLENREVAARLASMVAAEVKKVPEETAKLVQVQRSAPAEPSSATPAPRPPAIKQTDEDQFFARFREVWINCPARQFDTKEYRDSAEWFNKLSNEEFDKFLATCKNREAHIPKRQWPPRSASEVTQPTPALQEDATPGTSLGYDYSRVRRIWVPRIQ